MNNIYLIDKENIGIGFGGELKNLSESDLLIVFQWNKEKVISSKLLNELANTKARVEIIHFSTHTKNALDFQLCTYLGVLYGRYKTSPNYYIVSKDKGYMAAVEFMKNMDGKIKIRQIDNIGNQDMVLKKEILSLLGDSYNQKAIKTVRQGLVSTSNLSEFHTYLQKNLSHDFHDAFIKIRPSYESLRAIC